MKQYRVEVGLEGQQEVLDWLRANTNHSFNIDTEYNYEPTKEFPAGSAVLMLDLDQVAIGKLEKFLNP